MPTTVLETRVAAPIEGCFDLARDVDAHQQSAAQTGERAVDGVPSGLIGLGDTVTWEAVHFGARQRLTVIIGHYDRPYAFTDEMVRGAFAALRHEHQFTVVAGATLMRDTFT